jgi:hypothetical protein
MTKINTIPIVFPAGAYGTYLHWCLDTLTTKGPISAPFTHIGNSHNFKGGHLENMQGWNNFVALPSDRLFVRFHPKTTRKESLSKNLDQICDQANHVIYLCPDHESVLLMINNMFTKIWDNWFDRIFSVELDPMIIYKNWPVDPTLPISQLPPWVLREFLSLYLLPAWNSQVEWGNLHHQNQDNCCVVTVTELLTQIESTLTRIQKFCQLDYQRSVADLLDYHQTNLGLQKFLTQDRICQTIVDSIMEHKMHTWEPLPLPSEAWIQWQLRNLGYELRCHGLDMFPTNSVQLRELLYRV